MAMKQPPWDQRFARVLVKPLVKTPITPNQLTIATLVIALAGSGLVATGNITAMNWGAGLFVLARFFDHFDGELARQQGTFSKLGYYLDYTVGALSYGAFFLCIGIGLWQGPLGLWALALGAAGSLSAVLSLPVNLDIDKIHGGDAIGYPGVICFELEDGIYLIAPITWLGYLDTFFVAVGLGAIVYLLWSVWSLSRLRRAQPLQEHHGEN